LLLLGLHRSGHSLANPPTHTHTAYIRAYPYDHRDVCSRDAAANSHTDADTHTHPCAHHLAHTHARTHAHASALAANGDAHADAHTNADTSTCHTHIDAHTTTNDDDTTDVDACFNFNPHAHPDRHTDDQSDADEHRCSADADTYRDSCAHNDQNGNTHCNRNHYTITDANAHPITYTASDVDAHSHTYLTSDGDASPICHTMNTLYIVGTPIGNLEDITLRALRVLKQVGLIAAEDTRKTRLLLDHFDIRTPLTSYFEHNKLNKLDDIFNELQQHDVALVSEAGMPGLSDPGYELIRDALARGVEVVVIPGVSAVISALVVSGLPTDQFVFVGFLPRKSGERKKWLMALAAERRTLIAYEAPHRIAESLRDVLSVWGNRPIAIARELTKSHEEMFRGTVNEAHTHFTTHEPRGEFTLVIGGAPAPATWDETQVRAALEHLTHTGLSRQAAIKQVAQQAGWAKREVYAVWVKEVASRQ
jgi:16S rRNA (cytidine1402-2'-O)-methyltransferase